MADALDQARLSPKAGFWIRALATIIDGFIIYAANLVLTFVIGSLRLEVGSSLLLAVFRFLTWPTVYVGYFLFFWTYSGQTVGHKVLGLRVIRTDGRPLGLGIAAVRYFGEFLSYMTLGIGLIWVGFDAEKQGWHDKLARTYVIRVEGRRTRSQATPEVVSFGDVFGDRPAE